MAVEIEKKFLVDLEKLGKLENGYAIKQGYIQTVDNTVVRVRIKADKAFLTIKGENVGLKRLEFEYPIPLADAQEMLEKLCIKPIIDKTRYLITQGEHTWELDVFYGDNEGLIIAEIELESEDEYFELPSWVKEEVTSDIKYYNNNLLKYPYKKWKTTTKE